jgi:hypothetical protein
VNDWLEVARTAPSADSAVTWMVMLELPPVADVRCPMLQKKTKWVEAGTPAVGFLPLSQDQVPWRLPPGMTMVAVAEKAEGH